MILVALTSDQKAFWYVALGLGLADRAAHQRDAHDLPLPVELGELAGGEVAQP